MPRIRNFCKTPTPRRPGRLASVEYIHMVYTRSLLAPYASSEAHRRGSSGPRATTVVARTTPPGGPAPSGHHVWRLSAKRIPYREPRQPAVVSIWEQETVWQFVLIRGLAVSTLYRASLVSIYALM